MDATYTFNKFPHGTFEISAAVLFQREKNIGDVLYADIVRLINDYTTILEEQIKCCSGFYMAYNNKFIIEYIANFEQTDILNSSDSNASTESITDKRNRLRDIESMVDIVYSNILRDIIWRRYRIYKNQIKKFLR
jgi:hypothetical protein